MAITEDGVFLVMAIRRKQCVLSVRLGDAQDDIAFDELLLAACGVLQGGLSEAVEIAQALGRFVENGDGVDAVPDSPSADAGRTMRVPDYNGPPWTESVPHPGVWQGVEGLPECGVRLSATPTEAIPSLRWTPCASGEAGCEEAVAVNGLGYVSFPGRAIFHEDACLTSTTSPR